MSSQNEIKINDSTTITPKDIFKEFQNDITIFLNKYSNYFESSYKAEADTVEKLNQFIDMIQDYEANLKKKLSSYEDKIAEIQQKFFSFSKVKK